MHHKRITIIGAGLVGALTATLLARRGFAVTLYEKRPDPRATGFAGGRSINLALAERGLQALRQAGLERAVLEQAVMMRGRMVHLLEGKEHLQRYGIDDSEVIWSVSRGGLNVTLLDAAEEAGATMQFNHALIDADLAGGRLHLKDADGQIRVVDAGLIIGADGAGSALRAAMSRHADLGEHVEPLDHGYKELEIPARADADGAHRFRIEPHALHIWPRGNYMCIALPNAEGSFTVTLFMRHAGATPSFADFPDAPRARSFFARAFPDALALMPHFDRDFTTNPVSQLATLYLDRWHLEGRAVLLGDAAHALVPFHGQGMNAGFEDATALAQCIASDDDTGIALARFQEMRKPNADAIAAMALENYVEMRDTVADPHYLQKRALEKVLAERAPHHFMSRYRMVTFTHLPYTYAQERGRAQDTLLDHLLQGGNAEDVNTEAAIRTLKATLPPLPSAARR